MSWNSCGNHEKVTLVVFLSGAIFAAIALIPVWKYPVTKHYLETIRSQAAKTNDA